VAGAQIGKLREIITNKAEIQTREVFMGRIGPAASEKLRSAKLQSNPSLQGKEKKKKKSLPP